MKRRCMWGPNGWGRSTWECGGEGPAWWAGWGAGWPAPWSGTCPGTRQGKCPSWMASPRKRNLDMLLWFSDVMLLSCLLGKEVSGKCHWYWSHNFHDCGHHSRSLILSWRKIITACIFLFHSFAKASDTLSTLSMIPLDENYSINFFLFINHVSETKLLIGYRKMSMI